MFEIKIIPIELLKLFAFKIVHIINPPMKLLPISPMNIFEGCQFQIKNPAKEPIIPIVVPDTNVTEDINTTILNPPSMPSIPSMKLQKFIIPVQIKVTNIKIKILKRVFSINKRLLKYAEL